MAQDFVSLRQLKRDTKKLKKANPGMRHGEALEAVARSLGYQSYHQARKQLEAADEQ